MFCLVRYVLSICLYRYVLSINYIDILVSINCIYMFVSIYLYQNQSISYAICYHIKNDIIGKRQKTAPPCVAWACVLLDKIKASKVIYLVCFLLVCFLLVDNTLANNILVNNTLAKNRLVRVAGSHAPFRSKKYA